ncbi:putative ABC transporter, ATP-binding subunit [Streptomyces sp. Tu6071]|nr:putative ABC transporter, ATP-binding subunit [Streptomyces sp. Tu6071]
MSHPRAPRPENAALIARRDARGPYEPCRGVERPDPSGVDHRDAVAQAWGLLHEVRDEEDRDAAVADLLDRLPRLVAAAGGEALGGFVEEEDAGAAEGREGDREALLLAARELRPARVEAVGEPGALREGAPVGGVGVEGGVEEQGLTHSDLRREGALLELHAQEAADGGVFGAGVEPGDADGAAVGGAQSRDALDGRRLPRPVRSEDAEDLALVHAEGDAVDDAAPPLALAQVTDVDEDGGRAGGGAFGVRVCGHGPRLAGRTGAWYRPVRQGPSSDRSRGPRRRGPEQEGVRRRDRIGARWPDVWGVQENPVGIVSGGT